MFPGTLIIKIAITNIWDVDSTYILENRAGPVCSIIIVAVKLSLKKYLKTVRALFAISPDDKHLYSH